MSDKGSTRLGNGLQVIAPGEVDVVTIAGMGGSLMLDILDAGPDSLATFDAELFGELVGKIFVDSNEQLRFRLKNGLELTEAIERTVR